MLTFQIVPFRVGNKMKTKEGSNSSSYWRAGQTKKNKRKQNVITLTWKLNSSFYEWFENIGLIQKQKDFVHHFPNVTRKEPQVSALPGCIKKENGFIPSWALPLAMREGKYKRHSGTVLVEPCAHWPGAPGWEASSLSYCRGKVRKEIESPTK